MTDPFDGLRPPRRMAPDGGDLRAIRTGRRVLHRRRATVGGATGAATLAVASFVAMQSGSNAHDSIRPLDSTTETPGPESPDPSTTPAPGNDAEAPGGEATPTDASEPGEGDPSAPDQAGDENSVAAPDAPWVGLEPTDASGAPLITREITKHDPQYCAVFVQGAGHTVGEGRDDWCARLLVPSQVRAGQRVQLRYELCRRTAGSAFTLRYPTAEEVRFWAYGQMRPDMEGPEWHWAQGYEFPAAPHTLTVPADSCVTWSVTWSGQDAAGYAMEQGAVRLGAEPTVDESGEITSGFQQKQASTDVRWA